MSLVDIQERALLRAIGDPVSNALLRALSGPPRCIPQIAPELRFPQSSLYRKVRHLERDRLVGVRYIQNAPRGGRVEFFQTLFAAARIELDDTGLRMTLLPRNEPTVRLGDLLGDLRTRAGRKP